MLVEEATSLSVAFDELLQRYKVMIKFTDSAMFSMIVIPEFSLLVSLTRLPIRNKKPRSRLLSAFLDKQRLNLSEILCLSFSATILIPFVAYLLWDYRERRDVFCGRRNRELGLLLGPYCDRLPCLGRVYRDCSGNARCAAQLCDGEE